MKFLIATTLLILSHSVFAATQTIECSVADKSVTALNRFTLAGSIEINDKDDAIAQLSGNTQMAGFDSLVKDFSALELTGRVHVYAAGVLGSNEITSMTLIGNLDGRVVQLIALSGLTGPHSTLSIQGVPFRAECKLR